MKGLEDNGYITLHPELTWAKSIFWMYSILINDKAGISRDHFMELLKAKGVDSRPFFYPAHVMPPYKVETHKYDSAESIASRGINLPSSTTLEKKDIEFITDIINEIIQ